jgi:hypothetical protein
MKFQIDHERNPIKLVSEMTNIFSSPAAEKHFERHLFQSGKAGGTFIPAIHHLNDLLQIIHTLEPIESREQGRMRKAFVFSNNAPIGYMGITQRLPEHESRLEYEYRDRMGADPNFHGHCTMVQVAMEHHYGSSGGRIISLSLQQNGTAIESRGAGLLEKQRTH